MQKTLNEFVIGETGVISSIGGDGKIRRRLFDMGVTPGASVTLRKKAPLGDPIEVTIRGYELTLRNVEAAAVGMDNCRIPTAKSVEEAKADVAAAKLRCRQARKTRSGLWEAKNALSLAKEQLSEAKTAERSAKKLRSDAEKKAKDKGGAKQ